MKQLVLIGLALLLAGCAGRSIAPEQRDQSGRYDGNWSGFVRLSEEIQNYSRVTFTCNKYSTQINFTVADGYARGKVGIPNGIEFTTPVAIDGNFFISVPRPTRFRATGDTRVGSIGQTTMLIKGLLDPAGTGRGTVTFVPSNSNGGCRANFKVDKRA